MTVDQMISEVGQMSRTDRLRLLEALWDTLAAEEGPLELLPWQKELLDERLAAAEANPGAGAPWQEVMARLMKKYESPS